MIRFPVFISFLKFFIYIIFDKINEKGFALIILDGVINEKKKIKCEVNSN